MAKLIIAKHGGSILDPEKDLIFTSNRDCLKEKLSGLADTDASGNLTIIHGLSYNPSFTVFVSDYNNQTVWYSYDSFEAHIETGYYGDPPALEIRGAMGGIKSKVYYALFSTVL